jgi:hypothetical protein
LRRRDMVALAAGALFGFGSVTVLGAGVRAGVGRPATRESTADAPGRDEEGACPDRQGRIAELQAMEGDLRRRIEELVAADAAARFLAPPDAPARFAGPALRMAMERAIAGVGVGGRVDEVDCSAFPCVVFGRLAGGDRLGDLQERLGRDPDYSNDVALVVAMTTDVGQVVFGAEIFPRSEPRAAEIVAAFRRRRTEALPRYPTGAGVTAQAQR